MSGRYIQTISQFSNGRYIAHHLLSCNSAIFESYEAACGGDSGFYAPKRNVEEMTSGEINLCPYSNQFVKLPTCDQLMKNLQANLTSISPSSSFAATFLCLITFVLSLLIL